MPAVHADAPSEAVDANLDAREMTQALHCVVQAAALARDDEQIASLA
jgi:hypothetical protein